MAAPNELRLFLSSTFIDFQGERDFLSKKVFPALRRMCRDRGVEFTEIDLRWGLTNDDAEKGRIIGTCLEEIDSCRPFFIGLLGERYGWVPPTDELTKNPELRSDYPWIEAAMQSGQSATELEFRHGFLNDRHDKNAPLVYFRSSADASPEDPRVTRLKAEVSGRLGTVPVFQTPAELALLIERDLTHLIESTWPASEEKSWLEEERAGHAAFAQSRRKGYVANPTVIDSLNARLDENDPVLVVTGESGAGKSSLLSYWAERLRKRDPNLFIIEHYIGVTAASTDPDTLMRRIVEEIKGRTHSDDPVPSSAAELEQSFPSWLGRMTGERMLILIDAINQLNTDGRFMAWLPEHVQSNVRWVISATKSTALDRLRDRAKLLEHTLPEVAVTPITLPERRRVLRVFLANYQKKLDRKQEDKIVKNKKASSPLFLRTLLEELRLQGKHESLDRFITHYLASSDIPDLFARILERIEHDYGAAEVQTLLTHIWAAPHGLSESEIIESSKLDRAELSLLLHAFDYHLIRVKGRLSFFHDHLRQAVEGRYLDHPVKKQDAWLHVASYFKTAEASSIKAQSLPWLLNKAEHWPLLEESLLDISLVPYYTEGSRSYDLLGFWNILEKQEEAKVDPNVKKTKLWNIDVVGAYESALAAHPDVLDAEKECRLRYALGLFFRNAGWHEGAATSERRALDLCETLPEDTEDIFNLKLDISLELGKAYLDRGDLKNASEILVKALKVLGDDVISNENTENSHHNFDLRHINIRNEYARLLKDQGKYAEAEIVSKVTLKAATERFGTGHFTTQNETRQLADIMTCEGKLAEAELLHRAVIKNVEATLGEESLDLAYYLNQFGQFFQRKGFRREVNSINGTPPHEGGQDYEEAQQIYERAVTIIENRLGKNHTDLSVLLSNFAALHSLNQNWEKAEPLILRSLTISEMAYGAEHPNVALSLSSYSDILTRQGKYVLAEESNRRALAIWHGALGENHPETAISYNNLANLLRRQGKYEEAEECYAQTLRIRLATIGPMHVDTSRTLEGYGRFMRIKGDFAAAEDLLNRSHMAKKHSLGIEHHDTIFMGLAVAEVLLEQSKDESARNIINEVIQSIDMNEAAAIMNEVIEILGTEYAIKEELRKKLEYLVKPE